MGRNGTVADPLLSANSGHLRNVMDIKVSRQNSHIVALALAAACVPITQGALMYLEYRLGWPLTSASYRLTLLLSIGTAVLIAGNLSGPWTTKLMRIAIIAVWSYVALFVVAFIPGCIWAPACL